MTDQPTTQHADETTGHQAPATHTPPSDNGVAHGDPTPEPPTSELAATAPHPPASDPAPAASTSPEPTATPAAPAPSPDVPAAAETKDPTAAAVADATDFTVTPGAATDSTTVVPTAPAVDPADPTAVAPTVGPADPTAVAPTVDPASPTAVAPTVDPADAPVVPSAESTPVSDVAAPTEPASPFDATTHVEPASLPGATAGAQPPSTDIAPAANPADPSDVPAPAPVQAAPGSEFTAPALGQAVPASESTAPEPEQAASTAESGASQPPAAAPAPSPAEVAHAAPSAAAAPPATSAPLPEHAPVVRSALSDPSRWGRVDADRTVYVKTADGERAIGSWQAGEPEEGLLHFARRFDDLLTEVELIAARLASGHGDPKQSMATIRQLRESLDEAHVVGDVVGLATKLDYLVAKADEAAGAARQAREAARVESTARKQALVEEAEKIAAEATQWKVAGDRLRAILDEWKTIRGVDRKTDDTLWKRFGKARDAFNRRRGSHFAEMDRQRGAAKTRKEEIVAEAERLADSTEWGPTAGRYKQLMVDWKAAGRAPKDADDVLWQRFRAAQDAFFSHRSSAFNERDSELTDNAKRKEQLLAEAEQIDPSGDLDAAKARLARLQERWEAVGHVPRERMRDLEGRLRAVEERVRGAADAQWRRSDPEALARVAQFRERLQQFESQAAKARAAGDERRAKRADEQAAQWREWLAAAEQAVADR
jgi:hypothetical protein